MVGAHCKDGNTFGTRNVYTSMVDQKDCEPMLLSIFQKENIKFNVSRIVVGLCIQWVTLNIKYVTHMYICKCIILLWFNWFHICFVLPRDYHSTRDNRNIFRCHHSPIEKKLEISVRRGNTWSHFNTLFSLCFKYV